MSRTLLVDQRTVNLPMREAVARLPAVLSDGGVMVHIDRSRPRVGTATSGSQRFPVSWRAGRAVGQGHVEVAPLCRHRSLVEVALPARAGQGHAETLRNRLEGRRPPPAAPAAPAAPGRPVGRLVAAGVLVALVAAGLPAFQAWTRPQPVPVEAATARYRAAASAIPEPPMAADRAPTVGLTSGDPAEPDPPAGQPPRPADPVAPAVAPAPQPEQAAEQEPAPRPVPEPGVYRYATTGWEELSVPGSRRSFPGETAQTVTHTSCGFEAHWQPLEERWDSYELCVLDGVQVLAGVATYRSFFGSAHSQQFICQPADAGADALWSVSCVDDDTTMHVTARMVGSEPLVVAGSSVQAVRILVDSELEGATTGTRHAELWTATDSGLLLRTEVSADLRVQGPFGPVRYREEHTLHLADLTPQR